MKAKSKELTQEIYVPFCTDQICHQVVGFICGSSTYIHTSVQSYSINSTHQQNYSNSGHTIPKLHQYNHMLNTSESSNVSFKGQDRKKKTLRYTLTGSHAS